MITRNYKEWKNARCKGIGGSDAAAVLGLSNWKTNQEIWEEKANGKIYDDTKLENNKDVLYGKKAESYLIDLFILDYPDYHVIPNNDFMININTDHRFLIGSLDGEILCIKTQRRGVLEIKTAFIRNRMQAKKWENGNIPEQYYIQCLHYLLVTGYDFCILKAQLNYFGEYTKTIHSKIEKIDVLNDIEYLKNTLINFWENHVLTGVKPDLILPKI